MAAITRVEPTREQLGAAWESLRHHDPALTLDQALQHPLHGRLVRVLAGQAAINRQIAERAKQGPGTAAVQAVPGRRWPDAPLRHMQQHAPLQRATTAPAGLDRKRAASGERDDD